MQVFKMLGFMYLSVVRITVTVKVSVPLFPFNYQLFMTSGLLCVAELTLVP